MICPHCQEEHPDYAVYCPNTGLEIILDRDFCPECGSAITRDLKSCGFCGHPLRPEIVELSPAQEDTRTAVTIPVPPLEASEPLPTVLLPAQEESRSAATIPTPPSEASEPFPTVLLLAQEEPRPAATAPTLPPAAIALPGTISIPPLATPAKTIKVRNRASLTMSLLVAGLMVICAGVYLMFFREVGWFGDWTWLNPEVERVSEVVPTNSEEIEINAIPTPAAEAVLPKATSTPVIKDTPLPSSTTTPTSAPTTTATLPASPTQALPRQVNPIDGAEIILIPQGEFMMGSDPSIDPYFYGSEGPQHTVTLDEYWIYRTEVTNAMYQQCVADQACPRPIYNNSNTRREYYGNPVYDNYPVVNVTWRHAAAYCGWAGGRLPTEAEWEKAGRGTDGRLFPWGNNNPDSQLAQYNTIDTAAVGSFPQGASPYGLWDMAGNVIEWVFDRFQATFYSVSPDENPLGPASGNTRVYRGGSYHNPAAAIRVVMRGSRTEDHADVDIGFRCMVEVP